MAAAFDKYERRARSFPGLLAVAPIAIVVSTLGWKKYAAVAIAAGVVVAAGGTYLLTLLVRHYGRSIQSGLWAKWDGAPTTRFLRSRGLEGNQVQRDNWRSAVAKVTSVTLLTPDQEASNPVLADQTIEAAVGQLTRLSQSTDYLLVKEENINYGFERNLYGTRWWGRLISAACCVLLAVALGLGSVRLGGVRVSSNALAAGLIIDALFLVGWLWVPSEGRAKDAADRYATELLKATVTESQR